jgi:hypothetical protein
MSRTERQQPARQRRDDTAVRAPRGEADYDRRLRVAGLGGDDRPVAEIPVDEFRFKSARYIAMAINRWRGCREPLCRRNRGCMAPRGRCSNRVDKPTSAVERAHRLAAVRRKLQRELMRRAVAGERDGD